MRNEAKDKHSCSDSDKNLSEVIVRRFREVIAKRFREVITKRLHDLNLIRENMTKS